MFHSCSQPEGIGLANCSLDPLVNHTSHVQGHVAKGKIPRLSCLNSTYPSITKKAESYNMCSGKWHHNSGY